MIRKNWKINQTKFAVFMMGFLLSAYISPFIIVRANTDTPSEASKAPYFPGLPDDAVQYNNTNVTPVAQMEQVKAGEPALFCYRNTTMLMNCTKNCDLVFTADPEVSPKIFGFSIDPNQTMTLNMNLSRSPFEDAQATERNLNFYLEIEPNATLQLSANLRLHINQTDLSQQLNREVNASRLTWMYWNQTRAEWETVESRMDQDGYLVCNTDHFSTWTVAEMDNAEEALRIGLNMAYVYAAISVVVVVALVVGIVALKKRS
jgi:hypothetical protein